MERRIPQIITFKDGILLKAGLNSISYFEIEYRKVVLSRWKQHLVKIM
jgi:hypothetical protein